jgi:hypothetical protein
MIDGVCGCQNFIIVSLVFGQYFDVIWCNLRQQSEQPIPAFRSDSLYNESVTFDMHLGIADKRFTTSNRP